jgi:cytochrome c-type biogenesis protein CcmE
MSQTVATPNAIPVTRSGRGGGRAKFLIGGLLVIAAIIYLIVTTMQSTAQYFYTVNEIQAKGASVVGKNLRASGAVIGSTIQFDSATLTVSFTMANVSNDTKDIDAAGGLAQALHLAVINPNASRIQVIYKGPKPDLLKDEAQAIVTGKIGADGVFYADELLLKCPTRYQEQLPTQAASGN